MAKVWIRNNHSASVIVHYFTGKDPSRVQHDVRLDRERLDRVTQQPIHNGYVAIDTEEYDALYEQSKVFKSNIDSGLFVRFDTPPENAFTDAQRVSLLETEKQRLTLELEDYKSTHHVSDKEVTELQEKLGAKAPKAPKAPKGDKEPAGTEEPGSAEFSGD